MHNFELFGKIFFESIFTPALRKILKQANPEKYEKYEGNCCRQTAIFGAHFIEKMFAGAECAVWEGKFFEPQFNKGEPYIHAWILAKFQGSRFLIDYSRQHKQCLFIEVTSNSYPKDHPDYKEMKEMSREKINWKELFDGIEWYTGRESREVAKDLALEMLKTTRYRS